MHSIRQKEQTGWGHLGKLHPAIHPPSEVPRLYQNATSACACLFWFSFCPGCETGTRSATRGQDHTHLGDLAATLALGELHAVAGRRKHGAVVVRVEYVDRDGHLRRLGALHRLRHDRLGTAG